MANNSIALEVRPPNVMGAYDKGVEQRLGVDKAKMDAAEHTMQLIGAASMHAMGGKLDGTPDPQKYEEGLNMLQDMGMPQDEIAKFRGRPELAPIAARASMTAMQQLQAAQNDQEMHLALQKFETDVSQFDQKMGLERDQLGVQKEKLAAGETPSGYQKTPTGLAPIPGGPADPENPLNRKRTNSNGITIGPDGTVQIGGNLSEGQAKTAGYAERMVNAENEISTPPEGGKSVIDTANATAASANPLSGEFWTMMNREYGPNMTQTPEYQRYYNGAQEWVRAKLRKESGAAISKEEWRTEFQTYFPQPGDSKDVVEQKARLRANAVDSVKGESRGGYNALFGKQNDTVNGDNPSPAGPSGVTRAPLPDATGGSGTANDFGADMTQQQYEALAPGTTFTWKGKPFKKPEAAQ